MVAQLPLSDRSNGGVTSISELLGELRLKGRGSKNPLTGKRQADRPADHNKKIVFFRGRVPRRGAKKRHEKRSGKIATKTWRRKKREWRWNLAAGELVLYCPIEKTGGEKKENFLTV